jgi:transcriptional regulator of acetoin/glycerol metabolism
MSLEDAERALLRAALRRHAGSVPEAARALGLSRSAMYRRMEKLGLRSDG